MDSITSKPDQLKSQGITLDDVSRLAGVSAMTVSRAIHKPEKVSEKTLKKVQAAIDELGYIPNLTAGSLMSKQSHLIAILVPTLAHSIFSDLVQALNDQLAKHGYHTLLGVTQYEEDKEQDLVHTILGRRPDGIVLVGTQHSELTLTRLKSASIPVIEAWDLSSQPIDMQVGFSHEAVGEETAQHLINKGFRSFAALSVSDPRGIRRTESFISALNNQHNISNVPSVFLPTPATLATGREGYRTLLEQGHNPKVVVCSSDPIAQGVLAEAASRGLRVPHDVAVLGFGDLSSAESVYPSLSSIRLDGQKVGEKIAQLLVERLTHNAHPAGLQVDTGFTIIDRDSTQTTP